MSPDIFLKEKAEKQKMQFAVVSADNLGKLSFLIGKEPEDKPERLWLKNLFRIIKTEKEGLSY